MSAHALARKSSPGKLCPAMLDQLFGVGSKPSFYPLVAGLLPSCPSDKSPVIITNTSSFGRLRTAFNTCCDIRPAGQGDQGHRQPREEAVAVGRGSHRAAPVVPQTRRGGGDAGRRGGKRCQRRGCHPVHDQGSEAASAAAFAAAGAFPVSTCIRRDGKVRGWQCCSVHLLYPCHHWVHFISATSLNSEGERLVSSVLRGVLPHPAQMESGLPAVSKPKGIRARLRWMLGKQSKQAIAKQQV